jgi:DmsE family decaheme c-type cytochrome
MRYLAAAIVATVVALAAGEEPKPAPRYVGTPVCMTCHSSYAKVWAGLKHSQAMLREELPPARRGCEACHGPGGEHSTRDRQQIVKWGKLETDAASKLCLQCHEKKIRAELWFDTMHGQALSCVNCHEVHRPVKRKTLLKAPAGKDCAPCHDELTKLIDKGRHHPLGDDLLHCADCHAFHGSQLKYLLKQARAPLCKSCHEDDIPKTGKYKRQDDAKPKDDAKGPAQ